MYNRVVGCRAAVGMAGLVMAAASWQSIAGEARHHGETDTHGHMTSAKGGSSVGPAFQAVKRQAGKPVPQTGQSVAGHTEVLLVMPVSNGSADPGAPGIGLLGGRVLAVWERRFYWCRVPRGADFADLKAAGVKVAADVATAESLAAGGDHLTAAIAEVFARTIRDGRQAHSVVDLANPLIDDGWERPAINMEHYLQNLRLAGLDPEDPKVAALVIPQVGGGGFRGNSDDMVGTVAVAVVFVESDGSIDPNTYTWSVAHEDEIVAQALSGWAWWAGRAADCGLGLTYFGFRYSHGDPVLNTGYEPILHASGDTPLWVNQIMANLGYTAGDHLARVTAYNTWLKGDIGTDWAYTAFVCYNPPPAPNQYEDGEAAWAHIGGPYTSLLYRSFDWSFDQVFTHETGHIFQACDEYLGSSCGCGHCSHGWDNGNCAKCNPESVGCMMNANTWNLCDYTPGQIGWGACPIDLIISASTLTPWEGVNPGDTIDLADTVRNDGSGDADSSFWSTWFISTDTNVNTSDYPWRWRRVECCLASGATDSGSPAPPRIWPNFFPYDTPGATYYVKVMADDDNEVPEGDESNNWGEMHTVTLSDGCLRYDMNNDGLISIIGDVPCFVDCIFFGDCSCCEDWCTCAADCNCDGFLSIIGDVPCFVDCVYFGTCAGCGRSGDSGGVKPAASSGRFGNGND